MLNIRIIPFYLSIKCFNRSFHISSINYNEILDLKARIDALKNTSTISTDNNKPYSSIDKVAQHILLTDEQASKISDLDDFIKLNKQFNLADYAFLSSTDLNNTKTVVDEKLSLLVSIIKNIVNVNAAQHDILLHILKDKGIFAGILDILNLYPLTPIYTINSKVEHIVKHKAELETQIEVLKGQLKDFESKIANMSYGTNAINSLSKLTVFSDRIDKTLNNGIDLFKFIVSNQSNIDLFTSTAALIGPFIAYRGLLQTYVNVVNSIFSNYTSSTINEYNDILKRRSLLVIKFNRITIPIIGTYLLHLGIIQGKKLSKGVEKQLVAESANLASVSILNRNFNLGIWLLLLFMLGAGWFTITSVVPAYKIEYPESYNYISTVISNYGLYILLNSLFLWCFGLCILYATEIYIFLLYSIKKEGIKLPKYFPRLTKNWLKTLEENSKPEFKEVYAHIYGRNLLFHLLIVLIIVFIKFWFIV